MIITIEEYKQRFENLFSMDNMAETIFETEIRNLLFQIPFGGLQFDIGPFLVRTSLLNKGEQCNNVSRCSYVPDDLKEKIQLQRCNFKGQQVFYASIPGGMKNFRDGAQPSLLETVYQRIVDDPKFDGEIAVASRWQIKTPPFFWFLPYFENSILNNVNFEFLFNHIDQYLKDNSINNLQYQNFTSKLKFLSSLFCKNDKKQMCYKITATYYNQMMELSKNLKQGYAFDGLIYPSANTEGEGMNIVLTKEYIDNRNVVCDLAVLYSINRDPVKSNNINFTPFKIAVPSEVGDLEFKPLII